MSHFPDENILNRPIRILGIETSCDETAAAVVENGRTILSNVVFSQIDLHALYGGVVPEIASRAHIEKIDPVTGQALRDAGMALEDVDAIAVTCGPGLVGALLTGVSYAKGLSYGSDKPLVPVHHIEGHICANFLTHPDLEPPFVSLVVSGGHSHLFHVPAHGHYTVIGCTHDDAAGEAFDKAARVLDLPYPGGPRLDRMADAGHADAIRLPMPRTDGPYDFSFSGLKTAFLNAVHKETQAGREIDKADYAASFRAAVVRQLTEKTLNALRDRGEKKLVLAGGVSANSLLRREMLRLCEQNGISLYMPRLDLCGDNAAMIASAGYWRYLQGQTAGLALNAHPSLPLADL